MEKMDIKKLLEYRSQLNGNVVENISGSIAKLNDACSYISDVQKINEALVVALSEVEQENQSLLSEKNILTQENCMLKKAAERVEAKEKQFADMELTMAKVSMLLAQSEAKEKLLLENEKRLTEDREKFESEKAEIISEKEEALKKAKQYFSEKNDAIRSRDEAIAEKIKAIDEKEKAEKAQEELREELALCASAAETDEGQLSEVTELMEWYRNYAIAVDKKIVDYFRNNNEELDRHYHTFLNDPEKLEEIHIHFPDYVLEETDCLVEEKEESTNNCDLLESDVNRMDAEDMEDNSSDKVEKKEKKDKEKKEKKDKKDRP